MEKFLVKIEFTEPLLGTVPGDPEIAEGMVAENHPNGVQEDELEAIEGLAADEEIEKRTTYFPREDDKPFLWDYQVKGFFKDAQGMLNRVGDKNIAMKAYKKFIDGIIFPQPRKIFIAVAGEITFTQRPLRAPTPKGERSALARSETIPAGSSIEFAVLSLRDGMEKVLKAWFEYGQLRGLGQWRNSGMGRFKVVSFTKE